MEACVVGDVAVGVAVGVVVDGVGALLEAGAFVAAVNGSWAPATSFEERWLAAFGWGTAAVACMLV